DVTMPSRVSVGGTTLKLNGMGLREATVFNIDVYVAGLYLQSPSRSAKKILSTDQKRRMVLHFVRDVDADDIKEAFRKGFRGTPEALRAKVRKLEGWTKAMKEGQEAVFTYVPGEGLTVQIAGRTYGKIEGADFAKVFFGIWLGSDPPNAGLKRGLLGGSCD
ncbi:MAG: chalcone isomerase family protein, partial [Polyangiales bacterium]